MTTVAYCAVADSGRTFADQLLMCPANVAPLRELTERVHEAGAAVSIQLGHCGFFTKHRVRGRGAPRGPSRRFNAYGFIKGLGFARAMSEAEIDAVVGQFGEAAALAMEAGFDAVELHLGHGYLLSQFLSPATNKRRDRWGGSLDNRLRLPLACVRAARSSVGEDVPILAKTNLDDGFPGGLGIDESVAIAQALEAEGVDALVLSGGFTSRSALFLLRGGRPLKSMARVERNVLQKLALLGFGWRLVRAFPYQELFFLELARRVRAAVSMPLALLGGVASAKGVATAMAEGFELVAMARALVHDPAFVTRLERGEVTESACDHCNECIAEMDEPHGVRCVLTLPE